MATSVVVEPSLGGAGAIEKPLGRGGEDVVAEEIKGVLTVYRDGKVERPPVVAFVEAEDDPARAISCRDVVIDKTANVWARFYVPSHSDGTSVILYFHGGGFCVGSAAWSCYHKFLSALSHRSGCAVMSVNYRLAPENPLPAAYEDARACLGWLARRRFEKIFLMGDSAGGNIAYHLLLSSSSYLATIRGTILIQPFFGGEARTASEACSPGRGPDSFLSLSASDAYWRLALPPGATRDHPWCNPVAAGPGLLRVPEVPVLVCVSELDILKDRTLELCGNVGGRCEMYKGVGHAFQILGRSELAKIRTTEMMDHIGDFISMCH